MSHQLGLSFLLFLLFCVYFDVIASNNIESKRKEVLITGGCGFVGRHFTHALCELGYKITIVDNMVSESAIPLEKWPKHLKPDEGKCEITFYEMDCREFFTSRDSHIDYSLFIHLAAVVGGRAKIEGSPVAVADDLSIDAAAFQWAIDSSNKKIPENMIYFSSSAAYPVKYQTVHSNILLNESMINLQDPNIDIAKPDLTYGWAKLTGEYLSKLSHDYYGLNISIYRPMSGYGEDQHEAYPFKSILLKAMSRLNPIPIWSDAVRDFIHITDIVQCVLSSYPQIVGGDPVNLGTGIATAFSDLAKLMAKEVGYEATVKILNGMPQGVMYRVGDPNRELHLGCKPSITIRDGIQKALEFMKSLKEEQGEGKSNHNGEGKKDGEGEKANDEGEGDVISFDRHHKKKEEYFNISKQDIVQYSSYQCIGGLQLVPDQYWKHPREFFNFPIYDSSYRTCRLHNVCYINDKLMYYENPLIKHSPSLKAYSMEAWKDHQGGLFYMGTWTPSPQTFHVVNEKVPDDIPFDVAKYHFLDGHSNSYNYGHYLLDNVMPHFITFLQFNGERSNGFDGNGRQVFESTCKKFGAQWEKVAHTTVPFNSSMGSFRQACLEKLNTMWSYFFDYAPMYLEYPYSTNICFKTLYVGQGSTYGLKSIDLSRSNNIRAFRDYVLERLSMKVNLPAHAENIILVGIRSPGHSGGEQLANLCDRVKAIVRTLGLDTVEGYRVVCVVNQDLSFVEEIQWVQRSKILISVHGTISYMSLWSREGTQQIILYDPGENRMKEHNILMYQTQASVYYNNWEDPEGLSAVLRLAMNNRLLYEHFEGSNHHSRSSFRSSSSSSSSSSKFIPAEQTRAMIPIPGTYIKSKSNDKIYRMMDDGSRKEMIGKTMEEIEKMALEERHHAHQRHHKNHALIVTLLDYEMERIPEYLSTKERKRRERKRQ